MKCKYITPLYTSRALRPNLAVDTDTLRQGAAQHLGKLCAARRLAAACRSLLR